MPLQAQLTQLQVGVGTANFTIMQDIFDRDTEPLSSSTGHAACRDNVQFVSLRDYSDQESVLCRLAKLLPQVDVIFAMAPIPSQRTSFFLRNSHKKVFRTHPPFCRDVLAEIPQQVASYHTFFEQRL